MFGKITKFHGSALIEVEIISATLPATMPLISDGIDNLGSGYTFAPGSTMIVTGTDKQYILGTDGTWSELPESGGGGSSGVTQSYVDEHDAAVAAQIPFSATATGTSITLTNSADGYLQGITIKGHSEVVDGEIKSIGDPGWGVVDLGTLTWTKPENKTYFITSGIPTSSNETSDDVGLCSKYNIVPLIDIYREESGDKNIGVADTRIYALDTTYTDATAFKSAMSGVLLYYPLADTTGATPTLGITSKNGAGQGTAATITTGLPLRSTLDGTVYDELTNDSVITRCEVVNGEVVAKATPVITPLTPTEKTVLASLRTYNPNTQIDVTDSPSMTVNYLLNTDNGQAVAKVDKRSTSFDATVTLAAASWTGASAPYTQTVSIQGITANDTPIIDVVVSSTVATGLAEIADFANITKATTGAGTITFSCYESKPTNDLTVNVKVVR